MSRVEKITAVLVLVGLVAGWAVATWKVASSVDRRIALLEKCSVDAKEADSRIVKAIEDDIGSVVDMVSGLEDDAEKMDRKIDRFDQELRIAHISAAESAGSRFRFDEARIVHLWAEMDSIRAELGRFGLHIQAVARVAIRLDSLVFDMRITQARRDSVAAAIPDEPVVEDKSLIKRILPFL